ncbi:hypothetical protein [Solirubrobacter soli]|uniref:hypothetical protein n=1 Tax=Solirubrobacter soli TaxID=363832 RepID=UPI0003F627DC|nr:hypothetical protein [Solirubrobacter soli]
MSKGSSRARITQGYPRLLLSPEGRSELEMVGRLPDDLEIVDKHHSRFCREGAAGGCVSTSLERVVVFSIRAGRQHYGGVEPT